MKFDIKKHIYLILLFILSFTVETAQSQEVTNIHIAATDTVPTYTSDSAVINFLKDAGIPITQNSKLKLLKSGRASHTSYPPRILQLTKRFQRERTI